MSLFSNQQVRHMYVANELTTETNGTDFKANTVPGNIQLIGDQGIFTVTANTVNSRFIYKNLSDLISLSPVMDKNKVLYAKQVNPKAQSLKRVTIPIAWDGTTNPALVGETVQILIWLKEWFSVSPENQYFQFGEYTITAADNPTDIANGLAISLARNLATHGEMGSTSTYTRPAGMGGGSIQIADNPYFTVTSAVGIITIEEKPQRYVRGKIKYKSLDFTVQIPSTSPTLVLPTVTEVYIDSLTGAPVDYSGVGEGHPFVVADMEWFYVGNRGDTYRQMGYPNNFDTPLLVVPATPTSIADYYTILDLGFWYEGNNEDVQKSQKQVIIAALDPAVITGLVSELTTMGVNVTVV